MTLEGRSMAGEPPGFPGELVGRGVVLRPLRRHDRALFDALYGDPGVMARVGKPLPPARLAPAFEAALADCADDRGRRRLWRIEAVEGAEDLGLLGLVRSAVGLEVGALLHASVQGRGHAADAIATLAAAVFAIEGAGPLWARHRQEHAPAAALMRSLGFVATRDGTAPDWQRWRLDPPSSAATYPP